MRAMGQMTHALLLGHMGSAPGKLAWYMVEEAYDAPGDVVVGLPNGGESIGIGFWIAIGVGGESGVPDMPDGLALDAIASTAPYSHLIEAARSAWPGLAACAQTLRPKGFRGKVLPDEPRLYLVQTEVA
jgi:hypothetical protein